MTLLTPNFADKSKNPELTPQGDAGAGTAVVAQHEPLQSHPFAGVVAQQALNPFPQLEQKMNVAPVAEPAPLKVACIGTAPSSRLLAPFNDPTWQIWGCSPGNQGVLPRVDVWFEIHKNLLWPEYKHYGEPYINWLKQQKFPIYMQDQSLVPNAITFPYQELVEEFGPYFFTSSFSWMMAFAMKCRAKEIALYGIDMASREEYIIQRPGAYYFMLEGAKRGIKVTAPYESDIMQPPGLYGFSDGKPFGRKLLARRTELKQRIAALQQEKNAVVAQKVAQLDHDIAYLQGADEDLDYMISIHIGAQDNAGTGYLDRLLEKAKPPESQG